MKRYVITVFVGLCLSLAWMAPLVSARQSGSGLRYWLPVDIVVLEATVTTKATTEFVPTLADGKGPLERRTTIQTTREGLLSVQTLADHSLKEHYFLDAPSGTLADTGLTVQVSPGGLLQSLNPTSHGRGGDILTGIAKFIGIAASAYTGNVLKINKLNPTDFSALKVDVMSMPNAWSKLKGAEAAVPEECNPEKAPFSTTPIRVRALLSENTDACKVFLQIRARTEALDEFSAQRLKRQSDLELTTKPEEIERLRREIADRTKAINATKDELVALEARLLALLEAFVSDQELGIKTTTERFAITIKLSELAAGLDKLPEKQLEFFKTTGVAVLGVRHFTEGTAAASTIGAPPAGESEAQKKEREKREQEEVKKGRRPLTIAFRQASPWRLELRSSKCSNLAPDAKTQAKAPCATNPAVPSSANTELKSAPIVNLIADQTPVSSITFTTSAMADRTLSIQFDEKGRPTQLSRSNGSSVAGIVTAVASASAAVRDEYATGLAKIVEIQSNRQKLAMQDINNQIERLQKEKDLVAAKLASASASQSFDLVLQQNQLVAELGLLKARLDVETAQGTYDQAVELARLKADLEQLKTQLEVVKTKLAIEEAKKGGGS